MIPNRVHLGDIFEVKALRLYDTETKTIIMEDKASKLAQFLNLTSSAVHKAAARKGSVTSNGKRYAVRFAPIKTK